MTNEEYIKKWLNGTLTTEEENAFVLSDDYKVIKEMLEATKAFKAPEYDIEGEWQRLSEKKRGKGKVVQTNWLRPLLQVAAAFLIMTVGYFFFLHNPEITIKTLAGQNIELYLPDSSVVILNAGSQINYKEKGWDETRKLALQGEAFFKVAKGSKFDVETTDGIVSVLGTEFNIKQRSGYFDVFCFEGLVQVKSGIDLIQLPEGRGFRVVNKIVTEYDDSNAPSPRWISGESYFESVPLSEVIQEIGRQYDLNIEVDNVNTERLFTGGFSHDDLIMAIKSVSVPMKLTYKIVDDKHIILSGDQ